MTNVIAETHFENPEAVIEFFFDFIYPFDVRSLLSAEEYFKLREYGKWHELLQELYQSIKGDNPFKFVKEEMII